ncbi:TPA: hypothetical protein ACGGHE_004905 [Bacillus pseudomycoides]
MGSDISRTWIGWASKIYTDYSIELKMDVINYINKIRSSISESEHKKKLEEADEKQIALLPPKYSLDIYSVEGKKHDRIKNKRNAPCTIQSTFLLRYLNFFLNF